MTLIDENVEDIDFDRLGRADLVCLTGMSIQGRRLIEILEEDEARGVMAVVGGPMATVEPEVSKFSPTSSFVGEADKNSQFSFLCPLLRCVRVAKYHQLHPRR